MMRGQPSIRRLMSSNFSLKSVLPTKSGCLFLLLLGVITSGLAYGIFWILMNMPQGS